MNTKTYNNENLTAYLLGNLPEVETERFDELSFTDDDFAAELSAAEKDLVDSYVNSELKGEYLEKFESYYLASPLRREKVEFARAFQNLAGKEITEKPVMVAAAEPQPKSRFAEIFSVIFSTRRPLLQWGFALAALVFMILGGWLLLENSRLRLDASEAQAKRDELLRRESELAQREKQLQDEITRQQTANSETEKELARIREERQKLEQELKESQTREQRLNEQRAETSKTPVSSPKRQLSVASFILTPSLRGNNQLQNVSIPPKTDSVAMKLELESSDYAAYRVVLKDGSGGQVLWRSGKIKSAKGALNVGFPAVLLKSQIYSLEVSGMAANGTAEIIGDYTFRVMR